MENRWRHGPLAGLLLLTCVALFPVLRADFVFDDVDSLVGNPALFEATPWRLFLTHDYFPLSREASYRPGATLSYLFDHLVWKFHPFGWHLTSLLLHLACVAALWKLLAEWRLRFGARWMAAALFAIHPLHVEAVAGISFREDLLSGLGMTGMALFYDAWRRGSLSAARGAAAAAACALAAQLSKENALTAPLLLGALCWADPWSGPDNPPLRRSNAARMVCAVCAATAIGVLLRFIVMPGEMRAPPPRLGDSLFASVWIAPWMILRHGVFPVLWPLGLTPDRVVEVAEGFWLKAAIGWTVVLALAAAARFAARRDRRWAAGPLWFVLASLPTLNLVPIYNPAADRYSYLPDLGLAMAAACAMTALADRAERAFDRRREGRNPLLDILAALAAAALLFCCVQSFRQASIWRDPRTLWSHALKLNPASYRALDSLGTAEWMSFRQARNTQNPAAVAHRERGLALFQRALHFNPQYTPAIYNLATALSELGQWEQAEAMFHRALSQDPWHRDALHNLGVLYATAPRPDPRRALEFLERARAAGYPEDEDTLEQLRTQIDEGQKRSR